MGLLSLKPILLTAGLGRLTPGIGGARGLHSANHEIVEV
ncbi:MAG: hypothetical protein QOH87_4456, partial [Trebonia sp.]|nr:hypothetical protein [Trebonia sp.]